MSHQDFTRLDIGLSYGPTTDTDTRITPVVEPFMLRDAPRARIEIVYPKAVEDYLIRCEIFPSMKYVCLRNMTAPGVTATVQVDWYDRISGEHGVTSIDNGESVVIPNPMKYDPITDEGGITLSSDETIAVYVIEVGAES